ncbi:hypothetical protein [Spirosoma fluviale]|uniref:Uncharacterized protein n=1 Tax=Spirosoma fluviale TaxID=1597977 RepID=A0A286FBA7_9BACT|nr:hypothetical protein [Spirosoma fluviale]SOD80483.1 hypothetical protein SAMN06269250_1425 [Spirosoma fluviale]
MKRSVLLSIIGILSVAIGGVSCHKNTLNLPEPATSLEGVYEAKSLFGPFLVNGETIRLSLKRVTADSVAITLRAFSNGQPGDSVSLGNALVNQEFQYNCVAYRIKLSPVRTNDELTMTCSAENVFNYQYSFPLSGQQVIRAISFKRI